MIHPPLIFAVFLLGVSLIAYRVVSRAADIEDGLRAVSRWITHHRMAQWLAQRYPTCWAFLVRRFSPAGHLGLHLTVGLGLSFAALMVFIAVAEDVVGHERLVDFDVRLANFLHERVTPGLGQALKLITAVGSADILALIGVVVGVRLAVAQRWGLLTGWVAALLGGAFIGTALKLMFQRPRPLFDDPVLVEQTWSFPSGHALGSLICYGMLAYLLVLFVRGRHAHAAIIATATALILLIGFSRLQLGVHYLSDVIAGYAAGSVWLCVCIAALETARRRALARVGAVERGVIGEPT